MQTFVPFPDFGKSVRVLDNKRLGKQRVEAKQILDTLRKGGSWKNHPAVRMWAGHEAALGAYYNACLDEWERRGFRNNMQRATTEPYLLPCWWGDKDVHDSHKARLFQKDPVFYAKFERHARTYAGYVWPVETAIKHVEHHVIHKGVKYVILGPKKHAFHPAFKKAD